MSTSPFKFFRKYDKILITVAGVVAILVFTVGDSLLRIGQEQTQGENPVVATWKGGAVHRSEMTQMVSTRATLGGVLGTLFDQARQRGAQPTAAPLVGPDDATEELTMTVTMLATRGEQLGIVISDDRIKEYLKALTADAVSGDEIAGLLQNRRWSVDGLYEAIRREMMAGQVYNLFRSGLLGTPPAAELEYYLRVNRRVAANLVAFPVEDYLGQVEEPSDAELRAYFEKYKNDLPQLDRFGGTLLSSPEPAFKLPNRAAVEYFVANLDARIEAIEVSEEELLEYYEQNKDRLYREAQLPALEDDEEGDEGEGVGEGVEPTDEASATEGEDAPPADDAPAAEEAPPAEETGDGEEDTGEVPGEAPAEEVVPETAPAIEDEAPAAETEDTPPVEGESETTEGSQAPENETPTEGAEAPPEAPADVTPEQEPAVTEPAEGTAEATDPLAPAEEPPATDEPAETEDAADDEAATDEPATDEPAVEDPRQAEPVYQPFEEVREDVRTQVARGQANEQIDELFRQLRDRLQDYNVALASASAGTTPIRPDFAQIAERYGLEQGDTPLLPPSQLSETAIGQTFTMAPMEAIRQGVFTIPYTQMVFEQSGPSSLFRVFETRDGDGNRYLSWKTDVSLSHVPELEDVREQVVKAWKIGAGREGESGHARDLALKDAEAMAKRASAPSASLLELGRTAGKETVETGLFSWVEPGLDRFQQQVRLSSVSGVTEPGPEFFDTVLDLPLGGIGVAMNHPKLAAYTVKVVEEQQPREELVQEYLDSIGTAAAQSARQAEMLDWQRIETAWYEDLRADMQLEWKITPDSDER